MLRDDVVSIADEMAPLAGTLVFASRAAVNASGGDTGASDSAID